MKVSIKNIDYFNVFYESYFVYRSLEVIFQKGVFSIFVSLLLFFHMLFMGQNSWAQSKKIDHQLVSNISSISSTKFAELGCYAGIIIGGYLMASLGFLNSITVFDCPPYGHLVTKYTLMCAAWGGVVTGSALGILGAFIDLNRYILLYYLGKISQQPMSDHSRLFLKKLLFASAFSAASILYIKNLFPPRVVK
jgi:hypothetical protein